MVKLEAWDLVVRMTLRVEDFRGETLPCNNMGSRNRCLKWSKSKGHQSVKEQGSSHIQLQR